MKPYINSLLLTFQEPIQTLSSENLAKSDYDCIRSNSGVNAPEAVPDNVDKVEHDIKIIDLEDNSCAPDNMIIITNDNGIDSVSDRSDSDDRTDNDNKENYSPRHKSVIHPPSEKPLCSEHSKNYNKAPDSYCDGCFNLLFNSSSTIPQVFAAMRDWHPSIQRKINLLVEEILKKGAHVDDMDGLEGNTMLHYACKSASEGVGSSDMASSLVRSLLEKGASIKLRSRWTDMLPLHFAAYFNCPDILEILLDASYNSGFYKI